MNINCKFIFLSVKFYRLTLCLVLSTVFVVAGTMKMFDAGDFAQNIVSYRIISEKWSIFLASSLPYLEIILGLALFVRRLRLSASLLIGAMMIVFIFATASNLVRGLDISCGCFSKGGEKYSGSSIVVLTRETFLFGLSGTLIWLAWKDHIERLSKKFDPSLILRSGLSHQKG